MNASLAWRGKRWRSGYKKAAHGQAVKDTLLPARAREKLEGDEVWSFVGKRAKKRWLWPALCRRTRQIVAFALGDHSPQTCRRLWQRIPTAYKRCRSFSDFWETYRKVFPPQTHRSVSKASGEINHMERWHNTLRQANARYVRKTLSFSKSDFSHELVTRLFIIHYNLRKACET